MIDFQQAQQQLITDRASLKISAQEYEKGIRELQKAYTEKTGMLAPIGSPDPGIDIEKTLADKDKEEAIMQLENRLKNGAMTSDEFWQAVDQVKAEYAQKIANLSESKPIFPSNPA